MWSPGFRMWRCDGRFPSQRKQAIQTNRNHRCRLTAMLATIVNAAAIIVGTTLGLVLKTRLAERYRTVVFNGIGVASLLIGISMALQTQRVLYLVLAVILGGIAGTALRLHDGVHALGLWLRRGFDRFGGDRPAAGSATERFAEGFLTASVLYCVGALAIIGSFEAGVEGDYRLLLVKSVMDGTVAVFLAAAYGLGVGCSALTVLVYQGVLTLLADAAAPLVGDLMLSEVSSVGGAMVVMIGLNLLNLTHIKTADYLPALVIVVGLTLIDPWLGVLGATT